MLRRNYNVIAIGGLLLLGILGGLQSWIAERRPALTELGASLEFVVTSAKDRGPGSLREAIFASDVAKERARILFRVPVVEVSTPLPALANPSGTILEGPETGVEIRASASLSGPLIEVNSPNTTVRRLLVVNAPAQGILVRSTGFRFDASGASGADVGLEAVEGADQLMIDHSDFSGNRIGVRIDPLLSGVRIENSRFRNDKDAGLWAVGGNADLKSSRGLSVRQNTFTSDRIGAVVGNVSASIENNEFVGSLEAAVMMIGQGARVQSNRVREGKSIGVFADRSNGAIIENNELDHNQTIGVLVRYSRNAVVRNNRVDANGYGLAFVLGEARGPSTASENSLVNQTFDGIILIGDSPVVRRNQVVGNHQAGMRILEFSPRPGNHVLSAPYLENNTLRGNEFDDPIHGEYRTARAGDPR